MIGSDYQNFSVLDINSVFIEKNKQTKNGNILHYLQTFGSNFGDEIDGRHLEKAFATSYTLTVNL